MPQPASLPGNAYKDYYHSLIPLTLVAIKGRVSDFKVRLFKSAHHILEAFMKYLLRDALASVAPQAVRKQNKCGSHTQQIRMMQRCFYLHVFKYKFIVYYILTIDIHT